jgi:hypothetical protein
VFSTVFGLPTHALIVHFTVVLVSVVAIAALVVALWPAARRLAAPWVLLVATVALAAVPLTTESGEQLEGMVPGNDLVAEHAELGETLLPFFGVLWLGLAAVVAVAWYSRRQAEAGPPRWAGPVTLVAAALVVVTAVGSGVQVVRIGHSGAKAVWGDVVENADKYSRNGD